MDTLLQVTDKILEDKGETVELESALGGLKGAFYKSLKDLTEFESKNIVRNKVARKYYPFLADRAELVKDRIERVSQILLVSMGRELIFRDEPSFAPPGSGKLHMTALFMATGIINFHPDIYSVEREVYSKSSLSHLPLPVYGGDRSLEVTPADALSESREKVTPDSLFSGGTGSSGQTWIGQGARAQVKQNIRQDWRKEQKITPQQKWNTKGFFSASDQSTDSLLEQAMKRLKGGS